MNYDYNLNGVGESLMKTLKLGATVASGIPVQIDDSNGYGHVIGVTTTASTDAVGLAVVGGTYTATPTASTEGTADVIVNPFQVIKARVAGSATAGALLSAATYHVLTQTSASATVVTATHQSDTMARGTMFGVSGANASLSRIITTWTSTTSVTVTVAFPASVAVGDKVVVVPAGVGTRKVQPVTLLTELNGVISPGTGIDCAVVDVRLASPINETNPEIVVSFVLLDMIWNPVD